MPLLFAVFGETALVVLVEMTHKMVSRACKGRRLTLNTQSKVLAALNRATGKNYSLRDLFNY
jgi:hypothetical protein